VVRLINAGVLSKIGERVQCLHHNIETKREIADRKYKLNNRSSASSAKATLMSASELQANIERRVAKIAALGDGQVNCVARAANAVAAVSSGQLCGIVWGSPTNDALMGLNLFSIKGQGAKEGVCCHW
jgi:hypothetical protein